MSEFSSTVYRSLPPLRPDAAALAPFPPASALPRGLKRRWRLRAPADAAPQATSTRSAEALLERILTVRNLTDPAHITAFLDPKLTHLHDPSLIPDLDRAAARLLDAADAREPIVIYGDYDADGITATTILYHTLRTLAPDAPIACYVPHRIDEGYGLSSAAIRQLASPAREGGHDARVIVSVDCGITAFEPADVARELGVDLIITDHHNPPATADLLPRAFAVVHPRRPDSTYPFGDLCGAGVAYKLAWRLATLAGARSGSPDGRAAPALRSLLIELLAPAALGAIADVVPLQGENRIMARFGLDRIKTSPLIGLRALVEASGLAGASVDSWDVGFKLAPRLNACGRLAHAREAVEMLTTADPERARAIADELSALNAQRREVESHIAEQAAALADAAGMTSPDRRAIVLAHPQWHQGVVGIVCSRLVERFCRPVLLLRLEGDSAHGSGRSIEGFNLHGALAECADLLTRFGGHDMAAGLALDAARLPELVQRFTAIANARLATDDLSPLVEIDAQSSIAELTVAAVRRLDSLAPFGRANPQVTLLLPRLVIDAPPMPLGQGGKHLALQLRDEHPPAGAPARSLRVVAWNWGEHLGPPVRLARGMPIDAVVRPRLSTYAGRTSVEPELVDLRIR
ncbi:MAG: single-stranded-DNA-specific exonuclease RecJ [Phycisphaerales bacterium]